MQPYRCKRLTSISLPPFKKLFDHTQKFGNPCSVNDISALGHSFTDNSLTAPDCHNPPNVWIFHFTDCLHGHIIADFHFNPPIQKPMKLETNTTTIVQISERVSIVKDLIRRGIVSRWENKFDPIDYDCVVRLITDGFLPRLGGKRLCNKVSGAYSPPIVVFAT